MKKKGEKIRQILEEEFNIHSVDEFIKAVEESPGLDIGIFTTPLNKSS